MNFHVSRHIPPVAFLVGLGLALACEPIDEPISTQTALPPIAGPSVERRIVGGEETHFETWRGVIAVRIGHEGICSGTLIAPDLVLTAGHCMRYHEHGYDFDFTHEPESIIIYAGADVSTDSRFVALAKRIVVHPDWNGKFKDSHSDLALILLDRPAEDLPFYGLRRLPAPPIDSEGRLVGYGDAQEDGQMGVHRVGATTLLKVGPTLIETGNPSNACQGDSGGPLLTLQDGAWVVTGVTSFGPAEKCSPDSGAYSVNLLGFCGFLSDALTDLTGRMAGGICDRCTAVPAEDWGAPCGPGLPECEGDLSCVSVKGYGSGTYGICASPCCPGSVTAPASSYSSASASASACSDVAPGDESCALVDDLGDSYCAVTCEADEDCPEGAVCKHRDPKEPGMCIGKDPHRETDPESAAKSKSKKETAATVTSIRTLDHDKQRAGSGATRDPQLLSREGLGCTAAPSNTRPGLIGLAIALLW